MRVVVQRVSLARVTVGAETTGEIGAGLLLLVGFRRGDTQTQVEHLARKCASLRIFPDEQGRMNRSLREIGGEALVVSQFTLYGDTRKGNRPAFVEAAEPEEAELHYHRFCELLSTELGRPVARGRFGAHMEVQLVNHGPVTILLERERE